MISEKLLLASSIALTFSAGISHSSVEIQNNIELLKLKSQLTSATSSNQQSVINSTNSLKAYYVRYKKSKNKSSIKSSWKSQLKSFGGKIQYEYDNLNTVNISIPSDKSYLLKSLPNVDFIEPVPKRYPMAQMTPWNIDQFQARDVWDQNRDGIVDPGAPDGSGVKFCIIDTGFYAAHEDFQGIVHSGISQIPGEAYTEDGNGHGSHVAGTANAVNNDKGVVGVMPGGAEFFIVKFFNNNGDGEATSDLVAAINACENAGANAISMSLGGPTFSTTENSAFQSLYENSNIVHIAAAGNDGDSTKSYPASYDSVISVAALRESDNVADFSQYPATAYNPLAPPADVEWDVVELSGGGEQVLSTWPELIQVKNNNVIYEANHVEGSGKSIENADLISGGLCDTGDIDPSWTNKIVLCQRGGFAFSDKINNVETGNGIAAIIYNNDADPLAPLFATCLNAQDVNQCNNTIPGVSITRESGEFLLANRLNTPTDVHAFEGSAYNTISGTSMATPGVAAGIAWAWDACGGPTGNVTNKQLRQLLRDSSKKLTGTHEASGTGYTGFYNPHTGFGLIQLKDALDLGNQRFGSNCPIELSVTPDSISVCTTSGTPTADYSATLDVSFTGAAGMGFSGIPLGSSGSYSINPIPFGNNGSIFTVSNLAEIPFGANIITLTATDVNDSNNIATSYITLNTYSAIPTTTLSAPLNSSIDISLTPTFTWSTATQADSYKLEYSTDMSFLSNVESVSGLTGNSHTLSSNLDSSTTYYWRVTAKNSCGSQASSIYSFTTVNLVCNTVNSSDPALPLDIADATNPGPTPGVTTSTLTSLLNGTISDINVVNLVGTHSYMGDLSFELISPGNITVEIISPACGADQNFDINLDDDVSGSLPCPLNDGGTYPPNNPLSSFDSEPSYGDWTLRIVDSARRDTGRLDSWGLEICYSPSAANQAPVVDTAIGNKINAEGDAVNLDTTNNFSDPDGDTLTFTITGSLPSGLSITNGVISGTIDYAAAVLSPYSVTVIANDTNDTISDSFNWTVTNTNRIPVADNDNYSTLVDTILIVNAIDGVLNGDTDPEDNALTAVLDVNATNGTVDLNTDGSFTYAPNANYCNDGNAADTFTYHANDGMADSNIATVSVAVSCVLDTYNVSVDVINLQGTGFVLQLNSTEDLQVTTNGISTFKTDINDGGAYSVKVLSQPLDQYCIINSDQGTSTSDITLAINCGPNAVFTNGFE